MLPVEHNDPINAEILAISEDKIEGFVREPFEEIASRSGVGVDVVMARIAAMLRAGTIRRVRQTLLAKSPKYSSLSTQLLSTQDSALRTLRLWLAAPIAPAPTEGHA